MQHEKIIKREDGSRVKIRCYVYIDSRQETPVYKVTVENCKPGKRTFNEVEETQDYSFRKLPYMGPEIENWIRERQTKYATPEEILAAKLELWEKMKPQM